MPKYKLNHPDKTRLGWFIESIVESNDLDIKILKNRVGSVDIEATEQQHSDFMMMNPKWSSELIKDDASLSPSIGGHVDYENLRGNLGLDKPQP